MASLERKCLFNEASRYENSTCILSLGNSTFSRISSSNLTTKENVPPKACHAKTIKSQCFVECLFCFQRSPLFNTFFFINELIWTVCFIRTTFCICSRLDPIKSILVSKNCLVLGIMRLKQRFPN